MMMPEEHYHTPGSHAAIGSPTFICKLVTQPHGLVGRVCHGEFFFPWFILPSQPYTKEMAVVSFPVPFGASLPASLSVSFLICQQGSNACPCTVSTGVRIIAMAGESWQRDRCLHLSCKVCDRVGATFAWQQADSVYSTPLQLHSLLAPPPPIFLFWNRLWYKEIEVKNSGIWERVGTVDRKDSWDVCDVSVLYSRYLCLLLLGGMRQKSGACYFVRWVSMEITMEIQKQMY